MYKVKKRDGKIIDFDIAKISGAIKLAFDACEKQYTDNIIDFKRQKWYNGVKKGRWPDEDIYKQKSRYQD